MEQAASEYGTIRLDQGGTIDLNLKIGLENSLELGYSSNTNLDMENSEGTLYQSFDLNNTIDSDLVSSFGVEKIEDTEDFIGTVGNLSFDLNNTIDSDLVSSFGVEKIKDTEDFFGTVGNLGATSTTISLLEQLLDMTSAFTAPSTSGSRISSDSESPSNLLNTNHPSCNNTAHKSNPCAESGVGSVSYLVSTPPHKQNVKKRSNIGIDLNKKPLKRPKLKKHRPKVVVEGKPKKTPKTPKPKTPKTPKPKTPSKKEGYVKRKYIRKDKVTATSNHDSTLEETHLSLAQDEKSCKRVLSFDIDKSVVSNHPSMNCSENDYAPLAESANIKHDIKKVEKSTRSSPKRQTSCESEVCQKMFPLNLLSIKVGPNFPKSCKKIRSIRWRQKWTIYFPKRWKKKRMKRTRKATMSSPLWPLVSPKEASLIPFVFKTKKRSTKFTRQHLASLVPIPYGERKAPKIFSPHDIHIITFEGKDSNVKLNCEYNMTFRSDISNCNQLSRLVNQEHSEIFPEHESRLDALVADKLKKKGAKEHSYVLTRDLVHYEEEREKVLQITQRFKCLTINDAQESTHNQNKVGCSVLVPYSGKTTHSSQNSNGALVPHSSQNSNGALVPHSELFDLTKKRKPLPKVDLDPESIWRWNLLMEKNDNEGNEDIPDEDREKRWEEEQKLMIGRIHSFIARARVFQGDRRFLPWKGSVVDSVVGVFLTQNVSDYLSSSAFMSLAAKFPVKQNSCFNDTDVLNSQESSIGSNTTFDDSKEKQILGCELEMEFSNNQESVGSTTGLYDSKEEQLLSCEPEMKMNSELEKKKETMIIITGRESLIEPSNAETANRDIFCCGSNSEADPILKQSYSLDGEKLFSEENLKDLFTESRGIECQKKIPSSHIYPEEQLYSPVMESKERKPSPLKTKKGKINEKEDTSFDWDSLRKLYFNFQRERSRDTMDTVDWEAVRCAPLHEVSDTIVARGMNVVIARRIKDFLDRLVQEHGSIDLEWLRDVPPEKAKEFLLSIYGLGLKSVECIRLLTLHHIAFPVDTNVARIAVRQGLVPLQPLPENLQIHLLEQYPLMDSIQKYLWPRLCKLDHRTLYELHYHMITFGKVVCTKKNPNCNACPMRAECRHFASAFASAKLALPGPPGPRERSIVSSTIPVPPVKNTTVVINPISLPLLESNSDPELGYQTSNCEPIIEVPTSPEPQCSELLESDIEDLFKEDHDDMYTLKLSTEGSMEDYMVNNNIMAQEDNVSKALVALDLRFASIPVPKLKSISRLRTEHQVYVLPDSHYLLKGLDRRDPDDLYPYLLAIWTPGETANCYASPDNKCAHQESGDLCNEQTCFSCNSIREQNSQTIRGTILIPCRTAMRGRFPLNGTYFQTNEVFADHESSQHPINVPRALLWRLQMVTVYFGTSASAIFRGLKMEDIQHCFLRGCVCFRGFNRKTRGPTPLVRRFHVSLSNVLKKKKTEIGDE